MKKLILLAILDGFGFSNNKSGNAILNANTPVLDRLMENDPFTLISASGNDVGLPKGQMGNSEVGHTNIGAGRVVYQGLSRISNSINDGSFFNNHALIKALESAKNNHKKIHFIGLSSFGGVHSHLDHLFALLKLAKSFDIHDLYLHCFTDGRDVDIHSAINDLKLLQDNLNSLGVGKIATVMGRYFAMDRDNRWDRIKVAYDAMVSGVGESCDNLYETILAKYQAGESDEFIKPIICDKTGLINSGDSIVFFNFRPDRARQITRAFIDPHFDKFDRQSLNLFFVCFTQYDASFKNVSVAFLPQKLNNVLAEYISNCGLNQLHIAETEKYAHVTFFFNGGQEKQFKNEDRILIDSKKVPTYDLVPEMSANEITDQTIKAIDKDLYDLIILNFANCDMVGHTGNYQAAIKAVEAVDKNLGRLQQKLKEKNGILIVTADHGNAEEMFKNNDLPMTAHTNNKVIFIIDGLNCHLRPDGKLGDIAPTILDILNLSKPKEMSGVSLINHS